MNSVASALNRIAQLALSNPQAGLEAYHAITTPSQADKIGAGYCYVALQEYALGREHFKDCNEDGLVGIAVTYRLEERFAEANTILQSIQVKQCDPLSQVIHAREQGILFRHGYKYRNAETALHSAVELAQHFKLELLLPGVCTELAFVQIGLARPQAALLNLEIALKHCLAVRRVSILYVKVLALRDTKRFYEAQETLDELKTLVSTVGNQNLDAIYAEASVEHAIGRSKQAIRAYYHLLVQENLTREHEFYALVNLLSLLEFSKAKLIFARIEKIKRGMLEEAFFQLATAYFEHARQNIRAGFIAENAAQMFVNLEQPAFAAQALAFASFALGKRTRLQKLFETEIRSSFAIEQPTSNTSFKIEIPPIYTGNQAPSQINFTEMLIERDWEGVWHEYSRVRKCQHKPEDKAAAAIALARLAPLDRNAQKVFQYAEFIAIRALKKIQNEFTRYAYREVVQLKAIYDGVVPIIRFDNNTPIPKVSLLERFSMTTNVTLETANLIENLEISITGSNAEYTLRNAVHLRNGVATLYLEETRRSKLRIVQILGISEVQFTKFFT